MPWVFLKQTTRTLTVLASVLIMLAGETFAQTADVAQAQTNADVATQIQELRQELQTLKGELAKRDKQIDDAKAAAEANAQVAPANPKTSLVTAESSTTARPPAEKLAAVIPAVAPVRVLAVDPPRKDGLVPAFKMGPVKMTPYGFIKTTAAHDSSSPNGDDFPFIGLFTSSSATYNTGPTADPEFHLKARATRFGANIEWPDISSKLTLTGRIEGDFEGNFSAVDNRNVSSIRSNEPQLRLAYVRMDYAPRDGTSIYFEGGQDWTLFGSSALPNLLETTFLAAYYGDVYERSPQMMVGFVQKLAGSLRLNPAFAIMMPSSGQVEKSATINAVGGLGDQLGQAEREGADADRPEYEGRLALQFQLDRAPGVAPAQLIWSGFRSRRTSIVTSSDYATDLLPGACGGTVAAGTLCGSYVAAFPNGYQASSKEWGNQLALQLPTRFATLVLSGYRGGDLRFMFGGQANSFVTDLTGLAADSVVKFDTVDGLGNAAVACSVDPALNGGICPTGDAVVAPERPIRAFGGFVNLGLPLSRWFNADPKGHNAGWQLFLHAGKDQLVSRDALGSPVHLNAVTGESNFTGQNRLLMGKLFAGTLIYKLNPFCSFVIEQSVYGARLTPFVSDAVYTIAGKTGKLWQDHRTEFGPVFTF
ncbi:MAG: hypothetical protein ABSD75_17825 [Terriglobales bacterium]